MGRYGKFNAIKVKDDGHTFDSKAEHRRYCELKLLLQAKEITGLEIHPSFPIIINGKKVCIVELDFAYKPRPLGTMKYEDVKGLDTPMSKLKRKMLLAAYPDLQLDVLSLKAK